MRPGALEALQSSACDGFWTGPFDYRLPPELIAQHPTERREAARLLVLCRRTGRIEHRTVADLPGLLDAGDLVVANDSRVLPARLVGKKPSAGRVEFLVLALEPAGAIPALVRASRPVRAGVRLKLEGGYGCRVVAADAPGRCVLDFGEADLREVLARIGRVPLPPYVRRGQESDTTDRERYQTVFARVDGSVAAPTAGLHLTQGCIDELHARGVGFATVTLHVGAGTFMPIRTTIDDHRMEEEACVVSEGLARDVTRVRASGRRVVAVGTTAVRALESASTVDGGVRAFVGSASLFIRPGYRFRAVDVLLTNFHLPRSTLLSLVTAFAGMERIQAAYRTAVEERYRFYSYGDAMLIH